MNRLRSILIFSGMAALLFMPACGEGEKEPDGMTAEAPAVASVETLENGLKLIIRPHRAAGAPLVTVAARTEAGSDRETPPEVGFAALLARLLSVGGKDSPAEALAAVGSSLVVDLQPDSLFISATVLSSDAEIAAAAVFQILTMEPTDEQLLRERDRLVADLRSIAAGSEARATELVDYYLFPRSSYGATIKDRISALEKLTPELFRRFAVRCLRPENTVVVATGSLSAGFVGSLRSKAAEWGVEKAELPLREWLRPDRIEPLTIVPRDGSEASLILARIMPDADPETLYQMMAVNFILNGHSTYSRLTGLQVVTRLDNPITSTLSFRRGGSCQIVRAVVPASRTGEILERIRQQLEFLYEGKIKGTRLLEQEISDARNSLRGGLIRRTETTAGLARFILWSEGFGFPSSEVADHLDLIEAITKESLLGVIAQRFDPQRFVLVAAGPVGTLRNQLSRFGEPVIAQP